MRTGSDFEDEDLDSDDEEIVGSEAASKIKQRKEAGSDEDMGELDEMLMFRQGETLSHACGERRTKKKGGSQRVSFWTDICS